MRDLTRQDSNPHKPPLPNFQSNQHTTQVPVNQACNCGSSTCNCGESCSCKPGECKC
ncbi:hypothetical protein R3P38DRAFT_2881013 [Favolaschia claudopus]|uniref:Metallothionein n=1 Tax=Favolaschia claudopus TaxID=2862362 RepID=A0AAW0D1C1_9AGAR